MYTEKTFEEEYAGLPIPPAPEDGVKGRIIEILEEEAEDLYTIEHMLEEDGEGDTQEARNTNIRLHKIEGLLVLARAL